MKIEICLKPSDLFVVFFEIVKINNILHTHTHKKSKWQVKGWKCIAERVNYSVMYSAVYTLISTMYLVHTSFKVLRYQKKI